MLPAERAKASFNVADLITVIDGGEANTEQRRFIMGSHDPSRKNASELSKQSDGRQVVHAEVDREEMVAHAVSHFLQTHAPYLKMGYKPKDMDMSYMSDARMTSSVMGLHFGVFSSTLRSQCSDEQKQWWLEPSQRGEMFGCYAQTELSHGDCCPYRISIYRDTIV